MKVPDGLKLEITPEFVYPNGVPEIPEGYEFVRFGKVQTGELWLAGTGWVTKQDGVRPLPRIVVRKKEPPKRRQWIVESYGDLDQTAPFVGPIRIIREVKPITRVALREACRINMLAEGLLVSVLEALGIEVEPYGGR